MHDSIGIPACFTSSDQRQADEPASVGRSGQSVFMSVYRTKLAGQCRLITVTWCRNLLLHGLSVSVQGPDGDEHYRCKVELKPWYFWRKQGSKHFIVDGRTVDVVWDLKAAKFNGETEPRSDYYVAIICEDEVVLLLGDQKKDAYRKTGCRPSLIEPMLVSRREHIFGKRKFSTRVKFNDKGTFHDISVECNNSISSNSSSDAFDPVLEIRVDGKLAIQVKHLQWKFRGNESINVGKSGVEVFWDVHDWLFGSGPRHGLFIFNPIPSSSVSPSSISAPSSPPTSSWTSMPVSNQEVNSASGDYNNAGGSSRFCLFLYAWKVE
ncbi:uncharacterized protein LOC110423149 [Herrania umbratica]|uniref:Uncharacterized protein LOC110423149 n=1 Tax=Herrania umbratica TaxID=108875 RepID=A0A6J1B1B2_9ROSI|nr:uncharacterized protein LOC110423149 [Herrania umbratica]